MLKNSLDSYVMSSRVRLARNLSNSNFIPTLRTREAETLLRRVEGALVDDGFHVDRLRDLSEQELETLKERHLISPALIARQQVSGVATKDGSAVSVMINEEDHLRIQCILEGLELQSAYEAVSSLDDRLCEDLNFAYHEQLGFLTACPTNLGTGMRASVMMFLPGLHLTGGIADIANSGILSHMTFRGLYGEGSEAEGYLYQLSNRQTLGLSEGEILQEVKEDIDNIAAREEAAREQLYAADRIPLTDRIYRAWGSLTNSYSMGTAEFCTHLAFVKLGVGLDVLHLREPRTLDRLMIECRPANLAAGQNLDDDALNLRRAAKLREVLTPLKLS